MPSVWIDTHCHLDAAEFEGDRDAVVERARAAGVQQIVLPAVDAGNFARVRELAHRHGLAYALGIHPMCTDAARHADLPLLRQALAAHADDARLVAVGEIGLDHFVPGLDRDRQAAFLTAQLKLAAEFDLPVLLHVRRSVDVVLKHLRASRVRRGIAHAFNGSEQQADAFRELGLRLGFGGALTFDRALRIRRVAAAVPLDSIVMETDSPDIPPQWLYRTAAARSAGATMRNESAELPAIGAGLAQLRGIDAGLLARATTANARDSLPRLAALDECGG
ncbi:MAG TPA: TatD family hydrolase [Caldimonas sp.]|jgi:TatD DNase family protein|nr:TatD family hydrolase [Caldimonas sp.]HEX2541943.1 TatD family hydrolase [Caldimonas sp.]